MTKGGMFGEEHRNNERASNIARIITLDDLALSYHASLKKGKLRTSDVTIRSFPHPSDNANGSWSPTMSKHRHDDVVAMETDDDSHERDNEGHQSPTRDHHPSGNIPQLPPLIRMSNPGFFARPRFTTTWPYYMSSLPTYGMVSQGYPLLNPTITPHIRHSHRVPYRNLHFQLNHANPPESEKLMERRQSIESGQRNRVVVSPKRKLVFPIGTKKDLNEVKTSQNITNQPNKSDENTKSKTEIESRDSEIIMTNSTRPSVLVMQHSSSPSTSTNADAASSSRGYEGDDHYTTDSDCSVSPARSPSNEHDLQAIDSDEPLTLDQRRMSDSSDLEKPHKCHICDRAFRKHSALVIHHRVHSGEKPYKCSECPKHFSISGNLRRHLLIHTGERPYICTECSRAFNNPSHLTRHRRKLHGKQNDAAQK